LLEARWAIFFDHANIPYEYEYLGYKLGELGKTWYLPDFWLPEQNAWAEIKPHSDLDSAAMKKITHFEQSLRNKFIAEGGDVMESDRTNFYVFVGSPYFNGRQHTYEVFQLWPRGEPLDIKEVNNQPLEDASELKLTSSSTRWINCPFCERISLGYWFEQVRDVCNRAIEEIVCCRYCWGYKSGYYPKPKPGGGATWHTYSDGSRVHTNRIGYVLGSPQLMKGYRAAQSFKAPRKGSK